MGHRIKITKMMYGWSKWGGARNGLEKQGGEWTCQSCGARQPETLPAYMFPEDRELREFFRICNTCHHQSLLEKIKDFKDLIKKMRRNKGI